MIQKKTQTPPPKKKKKTKERKEKHDWDPVKSLAQPQSNYISMRLERISSDRENIKERCV